MRLIVKHFLHEGPGLFHFGLFLVVIYIFMDVPQALLKEDLKILEKPKILNAQRAAILAQMAAIVLLLHRAFAFVVKTTILFTKLHQTNDPAIKEKS